MEEDIDYIENNIDLFMDTLYEIYKQSAVKPFEKSIINIIARNKELEEINAEHQKQNGELQTKLSKLEENQIWSEATIEGLKRDFISKSKIKEIIYSSYPDIAIQKLIELVEENHIPRID